MKKFLILISLISLLIITACSTAESFLGVKLSPYMQSIKDDSQKEK